MKVVSVAISVVLFLILYGFTACSKKEKERIFEREYLEPIKNARHELTLHLFRNLIPGGSIAVMIDGELVWSEGIGYASKDLEVPASRHTKYRIGEISQIMTALGYNLLVEKGELHPDSSVQYYLPEFPEKKYNITLRHLANQSSGLRQQKRSETNNTNFGVSISHGLEFFRDDTLLFKPGQFQYSSIFNYNLLGAVIEKKTNKKFRVIISQLVTDTLGLNNTTLDNPFITVKGRTDFFDVNYISQIVNATTTDLGFSLPSCGYLSTPEDLAKLGNAFLFSEYISDSVRHRIFSTDTLQSGIPPNWANGWFINTDEQGNKFYASTGGVKGGNAALLVYPESKIVIALATNLTGNFDDLPVLSIAQEFLIF